MPPPPSPADAPLAIGATVRLQGSVPFLKTADPMPMLRPPDLVDPEELGVVVERRARDQLAVRFRRGTFLLPSAQLHLVLKPGATERSGDGEARPPAPPEAPEPAPPG
ncbi:MAG: NAD(P)H dehydrogenase assembly family protein [Cyanobacteriota bacterium]|jgi:hypothetical protein